MKNIKIIKVEFALTHDNSVMYESVDELLANFSEVRGEAMLRMMQSRPNCIGFVKSKHFTSEYHSFVAVTSDSDEYEILGGEPESDVIKPKKRKATVVRADNTGKAKPKTLIMIDNEIDLFESLVNSSFPDEFIHDAKKLSEEIKESLSEVYDNINKKDKGAMIYYNDLLDKYKKLAEKI